jgi:predicted HicB family RNase H-like nuclease
MKAKELKAKAARFTKIVEWSEEDGCFIGSAPPLIGPCCHGEDETVVYAELYQIVTEWIEALEADGKPLPEATADRRKYSGRFVLRVDPAVHRRLALKAMAEGESLNAFCARTLAEA